MKAKGPSRNDLVRRNGKLARIKRDMKMSYQLYIIIAIPIIWLIIFRYAPMYGVQIAFRKFRANTGILGSPWVGFDQFTKFFDNYMFKDVMTNTLSISLYSLIANFPFPIILALALNNCIRLRFKKVVQIVTYMPHFISTVVLVGMIIQFLSPHIGMISLGLQSLGFPAKDFMADPKVFSSIYVWSGIWQNCGWGTIIYLAALAGVDYGLHEAAMIDGASRFKRMIHVDLPGIIPTATILLIMSAGNIMNVGFEKVFLMQNSLNREASEVLSIYVYKMGLASASADFSYASAIGLFNSVVNLIMITMVNQISKKINKTSLW